MTQDGMSHEGHNDMGEDEQAEDDKEVEGYIWESM